MSYDIQVCRRCYTTKFRITRATSWGRLQGLIDLIKTRTTSSAVSTTDGWLKLNFASCVFEEHQDKYLICEDTSSTLYDVPRIRTKFYEVVRTYYAISHLSVIDAINIKISSTQHHHEEARSGSYHHSNITKISTTTHQPAMKVAFLALACVLTTTTPPREQGRMMPNTISPSEQKSSFFSDDRPSRTPSTRRPLSAWWAHVDVFI